MYNLHITTYIWPPVPKPPPDIRFDKNEDWRLTYWRNRFVEVHKFDFDSNPEGVDNYYGIPNRLYHITVKCIRDRIRDLKLDKNKTVLSLP